MLSAFFLSVLLAGQQWLGAMPVQARNTIEGFVRTEDRRPVGSVVVFLQSDTYSPLGQVYTDGSGRFQFQNLPSGIYYIQVEPMGSGYERQSQRVEANPFNARKDSSGRVSGGEIFRVDFVLKRPAARAGTPLPAAAGTVFSQEVPEPARQAYQRGVSSLERKDIDAAVESLKEAINLFPDYFDALEMLGNQYAERRLFQAAVPILKHATAVNKNAWRSFYLLGVSQVELKERAEGVASLRRAAELNPNSINANMRLGIELAKDDQKRGEAIQALERASRLADNQVAEVYLHLASLYSKDGQYNKAADALEGYLGIIPKSEQYNEQRKKFKELIEQLRQKAKAAQPTKK